MSKRVFPFIFLLILIPFNRLSASFPYEISGLISENRITELNNQKLLLLDFWATWCSPCIPATRQLEILQETKPEDIFIIAVSDESEEVIRRYLEKKPIQVAVIKDRIDNGLIAEFNVQRRPYSVLLTMDGKLIYSGHPSGITAEMIDKETAKIKKTFTNKWTNLFVDQENKRNVAQDNIFLVKKKENSEKYRYNENNIFYYSGTLSGLVQQLLDISPLQISVQNIKDYYIDFKCSESAFSSKTQILSRLLDSLNIKIGHENKTVEAVLLKVKNNAKLWDNAQFDWGNNVSDNYIIGSDRIEADNATIKQIANLLTELKGKIYYPALEDDVPRDWNFHYIFDDLMKEDLEDNFGIILKEGSTTIPFYTIQPQL